MGHQSILGGAAAVVLLLSPPVFAETAQAVVPVVANVVGVGGVHWKCRVEIRNDFNYPMNVFLSLPGVEGAFLLQPLEPGQVIIHQDIVGEMFGLEEVISPLVVQTDGRRAPSVIATIYGIYKGALTVPQYTPTVYGVSPHHVGVLRGLSSNSAFRTNIGLVNLSTKTVPFTAALQIVPGRNLAVSRLELPPNGVVQLAAPTLFPLMTEAENFSVIVESPIAESYTYAAVIDNKTNNSRYVSPGPVLIGP